MEDEIGDIDLSGTNIHNFLYNQGMRASRVREIYRLCVSNITPQPTPFIFGDEADRDRHALRRFRNALTMDLVPNVQYAYQQCGLRDDGQGMTPEELLEKVAELRVDDSDGPTHSKDGEIEAREDNHAKEDLEGESGRTSTELKLCKEKNIGIPDDSSPNGMDSETRRPAPWREPHAEKLMTRTKPTCISPEKVTGQSRAYASEPSATDTRAVSRGFRNQNRRPVSHVKTLTNSKGPSIAVPAQAPQLQTVCNSTRRIIHRSASAQLNSTLHPRPSVKHEAGRVKIQPSPANNSRYSKTSPGQNQRPLSLPTGLTRATPAPLVDTPVRRWR